MSGQRGKAAGREATDRFRAGRVWIAVLGAALALQAQSALARGTLDVEFGLVIPGYNDVAVPGRGATRFSLTDDFDAERSGSFRLRYALVLAENHSLGVLIAPLTARSSGSPERPIDFNGVRFPADQPLDISFRFDSYRLIYRYRLRHTDRFEFSLGGALKLRDAQIELRGDGQASRKANTGIVPLASFHFAWRLSEALRLSVDGEALAAPQGRAEDVLFALEHRLNQSLALRAGYRILEGGADNDEVYTFSLFHQLIVGASWTF